MIKKPTVYLDLDGPGGNSMQIIAECRAVATREGWSRKEFDEFFFDAISDDRDHLMDTVFEYFDVALVRKTADYVDREQVR